MFPDAPEEWLARDEMERFARKWRRTPARWNDAHGPVHETHSNPTATKSTDAIEINVRHGIETLALPVTGYRRLDFARSDGISSFRRQNYLHRCREVVGLPIRHACGGVRFEPGSHPDRAQACIVGALHINLGIPD